MKILYFNCFAGISGDMTLGALIDLGVDSEFLIKELKKLPIADEFDLKVYRSHKMGISGTKVDVILNNVDASNSISTTHENQTNYGEHIHNEHDLEHHSHEIHEHSQHSHENHGHSHHYHENHGHSHHSHDSQEHSHTTHIKHIHRNLRMIEDIINESSLSKDVKNLSIKIFMEVALAEAKVHGKPLEEVHFHEVGAVDSIVDIVGTAICIVALGVDRIISSTVELGGGFAKCAHGLIPVPAPATAEILRGIPVHLGRVNSETTTPTGAAILKALVHDFQDQINFSINKIGCGLGTKDFSIPNLLRVFIAEKPESNQVDQIMVETNIDDMNPELYEYIESLLFEAGARDVYKTNILMKKGRPAIKLSILVETSNLEVIKDIIFRETSSLGLRTFPIHKTEIERRFEKLNTPYGEVTVKKGYDKGELVSTKFEYEECKELAKKNSIPLKTLYNHLNLLLNQEA